VGQVRNGRATRKITSTPLRIAPRFGDRFRLLTYGHFRAPKAPIAWEIKTLDNKKFIILSEKFNEIGKMLGGWCRQLNRENPASWDGEK